MKTTMDRKNGQWAWIWILAVALLLGLFPAGALADRTDDDTASVMADSEEWEDDVYAILYDDGLMVFQHGDVPESEKTVKTIMKIDEHNTGGWGEFLGDDIKIVRFADKISPLSTSHWFEFCSELTAIENIENLDTSRATSMMAMFWGCHSLAKLDVSHFDTSNVTDMAAMFCDCPMLTELDVSNFDTSNVTTMGNLVWPGMFAHCSGLTEIDVSNFDTSQVTSMNGMFEGCTGLTTIDLSRPCLKNIISSSK